VIQGAELGHGRIHMKIDRNLVIAPVPDHMTEIVIVPTDDLVAHIESTDDIARPLDPILLLDLETTGMIAVRDGHKRRRSYSRSPSPYRSRQRDRSYTRSRSRSPVRRRKSRSPPRKRPYSHSASPPRRFPTAPPPRRSRSRSPTPLLAAQPLPFSRSLSPSSASSEEAGTTRKTGRLQPLQSSAIADLSSFLAADAESTKADDKRLRKAKWRAAQGLGVQEGVNPESLKRKEVSEKGKANREYQMVMNQVNKEKQ